jgi:hypothetical protein
MTVRYDTVWRRSLFVCLALALWVSKPVASEEIAAKVKELSPHERALTVDLSVAPQVLPPLQHTAMRKRAFAQRNSPEHIRDLADQLFAHWDWNQRATSRLAITRRLKPLKDEVVRLYKDGKYQEALDAFRAYFFGKVSLLWEDKRGWTTRAFDNRALNELNRSNYEDNVTLLMRNVFQARVTKETVHLGEEGAIRWDWQPQGLQNPWYTPVVFEYITRVDEFNMLWWKFVDTKDPHFLNKWIGYLDDYNMNYRFQEELNPLHLDYGKMGHHALKNFTHALFEIGRVLPSSGEGFPSATLARALVRFNSVILPQTLYYNREESSNHSTEAVHMQLATVNLFYDFRIAQFLEQESRRQYETYGVLVELADGSIPSRPVGYSRFEFNESATGLNKFREMEFNWLTPAIELEYKERLARRGYWFLNLFHPDGDGLNGMGRFNRPFSERVTTVAKDLPELFRDPGLSAISHRILQNQTEDDWQGKTHMAPNHPLLLEGQGNALTEPPYTSLTFPYNHTSIMRSGWDPEQDQAGVFFQNVERGRTGGLFRRAKNANSLTVSAFTQHLLVNGTPYAYHYVRSPIQVDGNDQFARAGAMAMGRKGGNNRGLSRLSTSRYHHSEHFDVTEGVYDGVYADAPDHEPVLYDYNTSLKILEDAIRDVTHRRVVFFVKQSGVWILLDLMDSETPYTYRQQWWMSKLGEKRPDGYEEGQVRAIEAGRAFKSDVDGKVNVSIYHTGPVALGSGEIGDLTYQPVSTYVMQEEWFKGPRADRRVGVEHLHLAADWKSAGGTSQLITVIYPMKPLHDDLYIERTGDEKGVFIKLPDETEINFRAHGLEAELTAKSPAGELHGIHFGEDESYEFAEEDGNAKSRSPIYRPIPDLKITPETTAFTESIEVELSCEGEGEDIDIRFTTDMTDPKLDSSLYTGQLEFTGSLVLKARAFRKGLREMPADKVTGTLMSRVFRASFTKAIAIEPLGVTLTQNLESGLKYSYYEDIWPRLLFGVPMTTQSKAGTVRSLLDISPRSGKKNQAFAFRYEGVIKIKEDGVYTIYAPDEFTKYAPIAGYDLMMELGFENRYNNGRRQESQPGDALNRWYPATNRHAFGSWSVHLKKGYHPIRVYYADIRPGGYLEYMQFKYDGVNVPGLIKRYFDGEVPVLEMSGPGMKRQSIPAHILYHL